MKIAFIGAGSVVFAKNLLGDILQFPELADCEIALMDIDPARLKVAGMMAQKMIARIGRSNRLQITEDAREAIRGAKYVICMIQVGGFEPGTVLDFEIPKKYGLRQTIADTLGVGGVFRGLRTIPVINQLARHIADVGAPGCLLLNYTNPMAMCCWGVDRGVGIPHVGLCHSVQSTSKRLASYAGLPIEEVTYLVAGVNHMAFFLRFEYKGRDAYPLLFRRLLGDGFSEDKVRCEMMRRTGYFVTESSEHQSEYTPYFLHHGDKVIRDFQIPLDEYMRRCRGVIDTWEATEARLLGKGGDIEIPAQTHEYGAQIIHSQETGIPRVIYGNVPNRSLITNLPEGCCVEVPCLVDAVGLQPTHVGKLPLQLTAICQSNVSVQGLAVEAALTGKREAIYHALMVDPHTSASLTLDAIWKMADELIEAHQKVGLLGEFTPVVAGTGRSYAGFGDLPTARVHQLPEGFSLSLTNPGKNQVSVPIRARLEDASGKVLHEESIAASAAPGATSRHALPFQTPANSHEGFRIRIDGENVLAVDFLVPPRRRIAGHVEVALDGTPAVEATFRDNGDRLNLRVKVQDSDIKLGHLPWSGSCVEFFTAADDASSVLQTILTPGTNSTRPRLVTPDEKEVAGAELTHSPIPGGYQIDLLVPKKSLNLPPNTRTLLLDCYATLNALGEAHSGGRTSLSGRFEAHLGTSLYTQIDLSDK